MGKAVWMVTRGLNDPLNIPEQYRCSNCRGLYYYRAETCPFCKTAMENKGYGPEEDRTVRISDIERWVESWEQWSYSENIEKVSDPIQRDSNRCLHNAVLKTMLGMLKTLKADKRFEDYL